MSKDLEGDEAIMNDRTLFFVNSELLEEIQSQIKNKYDMEDDEYCDLIEDTINRHLHINLEAIIEEADKCARVIYDRRR